MFIHSLNVYVFNINSLVNKQLFKCCTVEQNELQDIKLSKSYARSMCSNYEESALDTFQAIDCKVDKQYSEEN